MHDTIVEHDSEVARTQRLSELVAQGYLGPELLQLLLPKGVPHQFEKDFWDYKQELPQPSTKAKPTDIEKQTHSAKLAEIIKDVVSFYNSFGGYLVIGVTDTARTLCGYDASFDCDDLNKRIKSWTGHQVSCSYMVLPYLPSPKGNVAILYIPQRTNPTPAQFLKDAPESPTGQKAFRRNDIYFRSGSECKPAELADDLSFLCSSRKRQKSLIPEPVPEMLENNLGLPDPGLIRFVRREKALGDLWKWLCDPFNHPVRVLAGIGGVGKTTLAREFSQELIRNKPLRFERLIWLSAKKQFYTAVQNKFEPTTRVDFSDASTLMKALLRELAHNDNDIDDEATVQELSIQVTQSLLLIPSVIVVDDIDSLDEEAQSEVFHILIQIINRTVGQQVPSSRVIVTSRLDLGASPAQLERVTGLEMKEFTEYVEMTAKNIGLPWGLAPTNKLFEKFRKATEGSPIFAASILRLLKMGEPLQNALDKWKGSSGEEVRKFAFQKEISTLTDSQVRTLYALICLGDTSNVELKLILDSNDTLLQDDISGLQQYHLIALGGSMEHGGARFVVPSTIMLMRDVVKAQVRDPKKIEAACVRARKASPQIGDDVGRVISRVVALWGNDENDAALELAQVEDKRAKNNPDLKCLLGRAYLKASSPNPQKAEIAFRTAYDLGCRRIEILPMWVNAKRVLKDWVGIIEVSKLDGFVDSASDRLVYRTEACLELGDSYLQANNYDGAADAYLKAGGEIDDLFREKGAHGNVMALSQRKDLLLEKYVDVVDLIARNEGEYLQVWDAAMLALKFHVRRTWIIRLALQRLMDWWGKIEANDRFNAGAASILGSVINRMAWVIGQMGKQRVVDAELATACGESASTLAVRRDLYLARRDKRMR